MCLAFIRYLWMVIGFLLLSAKASFAVSSCTYLFEFTDLYGKPVQAVIDSIYYLGAEWDLPDRNISIPFTSRTLKNGAVEVTSSVAPYGIGKVVFRRLKSSSSQDQKFFYPQCGESRTIIADLVDETQTVRFVRIVGSISDWRPDSRRQAWLKVVPMFVSTNTLNDEIAEAIIHRDGSFELVARLMSSRYVLFLLQDSLLVGIQEVDLGSRDFVRLGPIKFRKVTMK